MIRLSIGPNPHDDVELWQIGKRLGRPDLAAMYGGSRSDLEELHLH